MEGIMGSEMTSLILSALRQTGEGVAVVDLSGNILYVNRAFAQVHGYSEDELLGTNLSIFHRTEDMPAVNRANKKVIDTGSFTGEITHLHRDGHVFPTLMQSSLVKDNHGKPIGIVGTLRDITDLRRGIDELEETRRLLKSVLDAIPDVIGIQDPQHGVISYNEAGYRFLNQTPESVLGKKCYEIIGHDQPCEVCATSISYRTCKAARVEKYVPELGRWLDVRAYPILDDEGRIEKVIEHLRDITDSKESEALNRKLEEQIRITQKLESLGVMAGGIAHDFNNILLSILGNADLASRETNDFQVTQYLQEIINSSKRAAELASQMLDYSGRNEPHSTPVNLNSIIRETASMLKVSISKKTALQYSLAEELPSVLGDAAQIRQVVMNLITNASEALDERQGSVELETAARYCSRSELAECYVDDELPSGDYVILSVRDTGTGMDSATLSRIFDPFFTTKFTGRGLGLAAVIGVVRAHRGAIKVYSVPSEGTVFSVFFPVCSETAIDSEEHSGEGHPGSGNVLIVDDEEFVRKVAGRMLEKSGYTVEYAGDGKQAVQLLRENPDGIDCILLDLTMPVMDGLEAFEKILSIKPKAMVIISSGFTNESVIRKFSGKPIAGILHKPYSLHEISSAVAAALEKGRLP